MKESQLLSNEAQLNRFHGTTKASNLLKSMVYSWFQLYERPLTMERIQSQMELLDDNVRILTSIGTVSGKEHFPNQLHLLENPNSAFHLEDINIYPCGVGIYTAQTNISFQSEDKSGYAKSYYLSFEADIKRLEELNYKFIRIKIKTLKETQEKFIDAYPQNRMHALVHHCMGLIEYNIIDSEILTDCFLPEFVVDPLAHKKITNKKQLIHWIGKINDLIDDVSITPVNIELEEIAPSSNEYELEFDLLFEGNNKDGKKQTSLSKNVWVVQDNLTDHLPKIKSIQVEKLEPIFI